MANWGTTWDDDDDEIVRELPPIKDDEKKIVDEAKTFFTYCENWEAEARTRFDFDYKFANGDSHNKYQWDSELVRNRELLQRPCLTINKTAQHNLMVINDAKQNKPGVRVRPVGDDASFEAAQIFQELVYHTEYISSAENIYDSAITWQVEAGIGYWRLVTDWIYGTFDQEVYIKHINDPRSVYFDPDINEIDGTDARKAIIFEDVTKEVFKEKYPKYVSLIGTAALNNTELDSWVTKTHVRIAEYYRKVEKKDKLVTFVTKNGQVLKLVSKLEDTEKLIYKELRKLSSEAKIEYKFRERDDLRSEIEWIKIAGNRIIEQTSWVGKYIPIIRVPGIETVIDGVLDRKGHTRALINAQQMYNYNSSSNIEYGALQTKSPWLASAAATEDYEEYWSTANTKNHSWMPYNHIDEDGNPIPPPSRPAAPQASPSYIEGMKIAQNEMMMASGQYQAQFGEEENAKSGVAINARQRQGDRATYHFLDNQAIAIRTTGKMLIDIYPKIYDTKRIRRIQATDGSMLDVTIDPDAKDENGNPVAVQKTVDPAVTDKDQQLKQIVFNPNVGMYDIQSDTGPSFATKRMETANALLDIAKTDKEFMHIGGDVLFETLDFAKADVLAQRYKKIIPPNITGDAPDPATEQLMHQASDHIQMLTTQLADVQKQLKDKQSELLLKAGALDLEHKKVGVQEIREDYEAHTKRMVALGNSGPAVSVEQIQPVLKELLMEMLRDGTIDLSALPGVQEGGTVAGVDQQGEGAETNGQSPQEEQAPMEGATKAPDGAWYVKHGNGYARVEQANA